LNSQATPVFKLAKTLPFSASAEKNPEIVRYNVTVDNVLNALRKSSLENPFDARISYAEYFQGNENSFICLPCRCCGISDLATAYSVVVLRQSPLRKAASMIHSMFESATPLSERLFLA